MAKFRYCFLLGILCVGTLATVSPAYCYTQANLQTARDGSIETIPLEATVQDSPAQIRIKTYAAGTFSIYRKSPSTNNWDAPLVTGITLSAEGIWTDSTVTVGTLYEYKFVNTAGTIYINNYPTGYILAGIKVDQTLPKGRMAVVVASDVPASLPTEYAQYKADLIADGWIVNEIQVPRAVNYNAVGNGSLATVKINTGGGGTGFVNGDLVYLSNSSGSKALAKLTVATIVDPNTQITTTPITSVAIQAAAGGRGFVVNDPLTISGGSSFGSGALFNGHIDFSQATLKAAIPIKGGNGYTNGDVVTMTGQTSGKTAQCRLSTDASTAIYYITVQSSQTGFVAGESLVMSGNSTGSGVAQVLAWNVSAGVLKSVVLYGYGSGYLSGDTGTLTGNTSGKTAQVRIWVNANGTIETVTVDSSQGGFFVGETLTLSGTSSGSGVGLFSSTLGGPLQTVTVANSGGSGYVDGDVVTIIPTGLSAGITNGEGILHVTGGAVTSITVTSGGSGFTDGNYVSLTGLQTSASGYSLQVLTVDNSHTGCGVVVSSGGSGYRDNDRVAITGATSGATAMGTIMAPAGAVTGISVVLPNTFTAGESLALSASSGGSGALATAGPRSDLHLLIRGAIQAVNSAYPGELKNISLIGKVPVCRSGISDNLSSDGHGNEAPYGADAFYADMDSVVGTDWTDTQDNVATISYPLLSDLNIAGDGKFDQHRINQVGNKRVELGFGRVDLSLGIQTETDALRAYFGKLHRYKIASADFQPGRRVCDRLLYPNEREADLQSMPGVVGMNNIEFINTSALPNVESGQDADQLYSTLHGPYLFYFKGSGGPARGVDGKAVFWTGMQSHWGFWYQSNLVSSGANSMQKRLAEDSFTLSFTWNIWGLRYIYHRMGMGLDAGDMMMQSINNQGWGIGADSGPYTYKFNNVYNYDHHGSFYMNHMGDPALRLFMFEPPSALSITKSGGNSALSWTASPNGSVIGYHVYRAANASAPFTRLTSTPVTGTTYTDTSVTTGSYVYMVRAVRLETTGGGSFYNASLGATQSFNLDSAPSAVAITTTTLPTVNWNTPVSLALAAQGGLPQYSWTVASGSLPPGLSLSAPGVISGTPTASGSYNFTAKVTDQNAQMASQALTLTVSGNSANVIYPEATTYTSKNNPTNSYGSDEFGQISGTPTYMYETFHRYDLSGLAVNNSFIKATLYLYVTSGTAANTYAPIQANLIADAQDGWVDNGIAKTFDSYANNGANKVRISCVNHGFTVGTQITIAGLTGSGAPTGPYAISAVSDADHFDIPVSYNSTWDYDPGLAYATTLSMSYNTRPTSYNPNVPTLTATGTDTPGTWLQLDVTSFVRETLAHDPLKKLGVRFFTQSNQTVATGSQFAFGGAQPYLVFETTDGPDIAVNSPKVNPATVFAGSGILLDTTVTPIPEHAGSLGVQWTKVSGPGTVTFTNPTATSTGATFSAAGEYVVRLTADDGVLQSTRDITVRVLHTAVSGPIDSSLKLRLALDETSGLTAHDISGVSPANDGTLTGLTVPPTWTGSGKISGALSCDIDQQRIEIPDSATNPLDGFSQMSISMWIKPSSLPVGTTTYYGLITKRVTPFNNESYRMELRGSTAGTSSPVYVTITPGTTLQGTTQLVAGSWYHLVAVFDGTVAANNLQLYVNGYPDRFTTITPTTVLRKNLAPVKIGGTNGVGNPTNGTDFVGLIDEVRIYNRALNLAEVQDLYAATPSNMGPVVSAGGPISGNAGALLNLSGSATDDGIPNPLTLGWNVFSGPGSVAFGSPAAAVTTANFAQPGEFTLRLTANDGAITTWAQTTASITAPAGMDTWRMTYFGTTDATGTRADSANPSGDGISNLVKYALGLDPNKPYTLGGAGLILQVPAIGSGNYMSYSFTGTASDVTYIVEAVSDLAGIWTPLYTHTGSAPGAVTVYDTQAVTTGSKRFMRLRVTTP